MPKVVSYKKGSIPYFEGDRDDRIFILQKGCVHLSAVDVETKESVVNQVKPGEFFGVKSALGRFPREETATAISDSIVVCLTVQEFEANFSSNTQIILKMLRVFSSQLRSIHKKIESILQSVPEKPVTGMYSVAKYFYDDERYVSCYDVCLKFLLRFPTSVYTDEVKRMFKESSLHIQKNPSVYDELGIDADGGLRQFELPAFERFAKKYGPGQVIISEYEPGDTFYLIQKGEVQLLKCVNGSAKNLDILRAGEFFGEMAILDNSPRSATCMAKTSVKCLEFSKVNFETLITGNSQLAMNLLKLFCKRIYDQHRRFKVLVINDNQARIADVFLLLHEMQPNNTAADTTVRLDVTISDIAHWAGLSYETTKEEMSKLNEKRRIELFDNYGIIENIADMKRVVDLYNTQADKNLQIKMRYKTQGSSE
ncbi:MAG: Crp/Fnr family transcriptional regulator [Treponema sp.]|nr:Crp/Fnr family transcriptional regulator [Treponema sp.]